MTRNLVRGEELPQANKRGAPGGIIPLQAGGIIQESLGAIIPLQTGSFIGIGRNIGEAAATAFDPETDKRVEPA